MIAGNWEEKKTRDTGLRTGTDGRNERWPEREMAGMNDGLNKRWPEGIRVSENWL